MHIIAAVKEAYIAIGICMIRYPNQHTVVKVIIMYIMCLQVKILYRCPVYNIYTLNFIYHFEE